MSRGTKEILTHGAQLAVAVFATVYLDRQTSTYFPDAPDWLRLLFLALISATLVEIATLAVVGRPTLEISWHAEADQLPSQQITIEFSSIVRTSLLYTVKASVSGGSILGNLAIAWLAKSDAVLSVRLPASPAIAVVDNSPRSPLDDRPLAYSNDAGGFDLILEITTPPRGLWNWADIRFDAAEVGHRDLAVDVVYDLRGSGRRTRVYAKVLKVHSTVGLIRFRSS